MNIAISGPIVSNEDAWLYEYYGITHFSPVMLTSALHEAEQSGDKELTVEINSPGGSVFAGFEIYSALRKLSCKGWKVTAEVVALAASAATTIMCGCSRVLLSPVAQVMIHLPMCSTDGNRKDHKRSIDFLKSIEESILAAYVEKSCGKCTKETFRSLVEQASWIPANEAIDLGLADGYICYADGASDGTFVDVMANECVNTIVSSFGSDYDSLYARYVAAVKDGTAKADPNHPVVDPVNTDGLVNRLDLEPTANDADISDDAAQDESVRRNMAARLLLKHKRC